MSVFTRNRILFLSCAFFLAVQALFAADPSVRTEVRMVYDQRTGRTVLFGGATAVDAGTLLTHDLNDTWEWFGYHWVERYPAYTPPGRSLNAMVYDSKRLRSIIFGGRTNATTHLNDTWAYDGDDWSQIDTANAPSKRILSSAAYDAARDRIVLFGGSVFEADGKTLQGVYDTWEFDGTDWKQVSTNGPQVAKPILTYDAARNQVIMLGVDSKDATLMYSWDPVAATWNQMTPSTLPDCVDEAAMVYQTHNNTVILFGGTCTTSVVAGGTWQWDGTTWTQVTTINDPNRLFGQAMAYDISAQQIYMYGGTLAFSTAQSQTYSYKDGLWNALHDTTLPGSRSLFTFSTDPSNGVIWMFGGINEGGTIDEFWKYQNGQWARETLTNGPVSCNTPTAAMDTDRNRLVIVCADSSTFEFDVNLGAWSSYTPKTRPPQRRFSNMVYDATQKKTVLFGGYDEVNYLDQTWLWDGSTWTQQKHNPPTARYLAALWYDPVLKLTIVYGGLGRPSSLDALQRYTDMWSFDGSGWTQMKSITTTPGARYGAQILEDPRTNKLLLFGGFRLDVNGLVQVQVYANDMWQWNPTNQTWTQLQPAAVPTGRENGQMAYDPSQNTIALFGGWNGRFLSDLWTYDTTQNTWTVKNIDLGYTNNPTAPRQRAVRH